MITSVEQITDEILRHGLLDDESLGESCHALEKRGEAITGANLLAWLVAEGKLTPFQAAEIENGRADRLVLGNYLVLSRLGEGGMGAVFRALHRRMQRLVAIKLIRKELATPTFIALFRREIRLSARLNHLHVVVAHDADHCAAGDFLVMEYVEGGSLRDIVQRTGKLSVPEAISVIRQAALGLDYAHLQGIVHRDIKPANLLREVTGCVKVVDLGLACVLEWENAKGTELSQMSGVAGTVDYMPPEQFENPLSVDARSDIYSLGCTLFYLLTGGVMFPTSSLQSRILAHREEPPPALHVVRSDVPPGLDAVFQRMVAKAPDQRFASMQEVVAALDAPTLSQSTSAQSAPIAAHAAWSPATSSVLVIEESRLLANVLRGQLAELGVPDVQVCKSGKEALEKLATLSPQIVMSSLTLPDMSGLELAALVRDTMRGKPAALVLMSGDDWTPHVLAAARQLGRLRLLKKPFDAHGLRAAIEQAFGDDEQKEQPLDGLQNLRVLIVDDSSLARRNVRRTLTELGFARFTEADDGDVAIEQLRQSRFDLIITDYNMPRLDGRQLIAHIRGQSSQRHVPVIMVTTEFDPQKLAAVHQLGVSAICNKSFQRSLVRNVVIQLFAKLAH
jgi:serine/threonine protein kinase